VVVGHLPAHISLVITEQCVGKNKFNRIHIFIQNREISNQFFNPMYFVRMVDKLDIFAVDVAHRFNVASIQALIDLQKIIHDDLPCAGFMLFLTQRITCSEKSCGLFFSMYLIAINLIQSLYL
jgi:hypothetical protein